MKIMKNNLNAFGKKYYLNIIRRAVTFFKKENGN